MSDYDVAIVGFGPGGEVLASLLGQAGHRVVVYEKFPAPYGLPRMSTLDGEIARLMQHTGDPAKALEDSLAQPFSVFYGADGEVALTPDWSYTICGHPSHLSLHQPNLEAAMEQRIADCPTVDVRWGREVIAVDPESDEVRLTARPSADSGSTSTQTESVTARYVVGMDGASSFVRNALGIELEVLRVHDDQWVLTDFDILDPSIPEPATTVYLDPTGPWYWGPNGARRCRTDVRVMEDTDLDTLLDHDHGYAFLEDRLGIPRESVRITRRVAYRFRSQYARSFRVGRVFIGGDAAHAMVPAMAQGSCSAMRDGANLAWKFDLVLSGRARPDLLDSYEPERLQHVIPLVQGSLAGYDLAATLDPEKAAHRDAFLRSGHAPAPSVPGLSVGVLHHEADGSIAPPVGSLAPQGRVAIDGREDLLDNLVGFGFQLISSLPLGDALSADQHSKLARLGAKLLVVGTGPGHVVDVDGTYGEFFAKHGVTALLARPDFYIYGVANGDAETSALVDDLFGSLTLVGDGVSV